jgi:HD-like signal output (HDOD) protein
MDARTLVTRIQEVCPVPAVAQRVIHLTHDPSSSIREIAETIATDPALAAEVLRIANGPLYGRRRQVSDLAEAVVTLGLAELGAMASAMAMLAAFGSTHAHASVIRASAVLQGAVARQIARYAGADPRPAFLAGLLADIGSLACLTVDAEGYAAILERSGPDLGARLKLELGRYGASSRWIGGELLLANDLPEPIAHAVEAPDDSPSTDPLISTTLFARKVSPILTSGLATMNRDEVWAALDAEAKAHRLAIDPDALITLVLEAGQRTVEALRRAG